MKILQVIPTLCIGGAEILCENLSVELTRQGNEVTIACLFDCESPITERLERENIPVVFLGKKPGLDFRMIRKLRKIINEYNPEAIHVHLQMLKYVVPAALGKKIPIVYTFHTLAQNDCGRFDTLFNRFCFNKKIAVPVALSEYVKQTIIDTYCLSLDDVPVIFNGVNLSDVNTKNKYDNNTFNLFCAARFTPPKNHIRMIHVFQKIANNIPEARLFLAGDGETLQEVSDEVKRLNLMDKVVFLGMISNVKEMLHNYDVFWLTSDYEGMPMTIIEAMAAGLPVVSTAVGGVPDMIDNNIDGILTGFEEDDICNAIVRIHDDLSVGISLGKFAKEKAALFSIENTANKYLSLYHSNGGVI